MTYQIMLADDQPLIRQYVKQILADKPDIKVVADVADGLELLDLLGKGPDVPDLVIVDLSMPGLDGLETTRRLKALYPWVQALFLTVHKEEDYVLAAFGAGAAGYVIKDDADAELLPAISSIRRGDTYRSLRLE